MVYSVQTSHINSLSDAHFVQKLILGYQSKAAYTWNKVRWQTGENHQMLVAAVIQKHSNTIAEQETMQVIIQCVWAIVFVIYNVCNT